MKPVTAGDVARFASGRITDPDEEDRIFRAILERPELEELYFLLTAATERRATVRPLRPNRCHLRWLHGLRALNIFSRF